MGINIDELRRQIDELERKRDAVDEWPERDVISADLKLLYEKLWKAEAELAQGQKIHQKLPKYLDFLR